MFIVLQQTKSAIELLNLIGYSKLLDDCFLAILNSMKVCTAWQINQITILMFIAVSLLIWTNYFKPELLDILVFIT